MTGTGYLKRVVGRPEGPAEKRLWAVGAGCAFAVWAAGAGVGLVSWWAREPGGFYAFEVLLAGYGVAVAAGAAAAAFKPARIGAEGRLFRRVLGAAMVGLMSANLCALGSILGVVAAAMHEAWHAGATVAVEQMFMLALAVLVALVVSSVLCGGMAVTVARQGQQASGEENRDE